MANGWKRILVVVFVLVSPLVVSVRSANAFGHCPCPFTELYDLTVRGAQQMELPPQNNTFFCSDRSPYIDFEEVLYRDSSTSKCVIDMSTYYPTPGSCWYSVYCKVNGLNGGFEITQSTPIPLTQEQLKACRDEIKHDVKHFRTCQ